MKLLEDAFSYSNQLGAAPGQGLFTSPSSTPTSLTFGGQKENADEKVRLKTLSLGVTVPDKFYQLVEEDAPMYLFSPYDVERIYGKPFSYVDITKEYDNLVANPEITKKKVNARELEDEISSYNKNLATHTLLTSIRLTRPTQLKEQS